MGAGLCAVRAVYMRWIARPSFFTSPPAFSLKNTVYVFVDNIERKLIKMPYYPDIIMERR